MSLSQTRYFGSLTSSYDASCRYLQKQIALKDPKVTQFIFNEVSDDIAELMTHPFGNYLCQQLIEKGSPKHRRHIIDQCCGALPEMSCNIYSSRPVQKLIENLGARSEDIQLVTSSLKVCTFHLFPYLLESRRFDDTRPKWKPRHTKMYQMPEPTRQPIHL